MLQERRWQDRRDLLIALGGNVDSPAGDPSATLRAALVAIARRIGPVVAQSRLWRTPAFPPGAGPDFVNAAAHVRSALPAPEVLARLHAIEAAAARRRVVRWGARTLDLDLIAAGDMVLPDATTQTRWRDLPPARQMHETPAGLILPHPRLQDRAFVLVPLAEVAADWRHPLTGASVAGMLAALDPAEVASVVPLP
ncbi:MAG: 2-amino-4-hydroxy-6-hydroxymethyldihydropteridine diphosphokinase [Rubellimicrobium sp.]|nr:2-amino-4-hydroxy-6-hydroxymethyldihydropteridine diphosphokinase [Rubellimicrobium sp.]